MEKKGFSLSWTCSPLHFLGIKLKSEHELNVLTWLKDVWGQIKVSTPQLFLWQLQPEQQWNISLKQDDFISKAQKQNKKEELLSSVGGLEAQRRLALGGW